MKKIVVLDGYTLNPGDLSWDGLKALGEVTVYDRTPAEKTVERISDAEIVYTNKTAITKQVLDACPTMKYVGVLATGYNVVDVDAASERGVVVTNVPTYGTAAVAQFVFALLLEVCHHVGEHSQSVHKGDWTTAKDFCYWNHPLIELAGKCMGVVGFGRIGRTTAALAEAFGMKVLAYDAIQNKEFETENIRYATLDRVLAEADVISLHCPLTPETKGMINRAAIAKMKNGVIIINTSRGPLIVDEDLAAALESGKVYAAGVDVVSSEPISAGNPLLNAKNCLITPHIAWAPKESRARLMDIAVQNLRDYLAGKPMNVVTRR